MISSNGDIFILDLVNISFLNQNTDPIQGKARDNASIDLKDEKLLTVSDSGIGKIQRIKYLGQKRASYIYKPSKNKRLFEFEDQF